VPLYGGATPWCEGLSHGELGSTSQYVTLDQVVRFWEHGKMNAR